MRYHGLPQEPKIATTFSNSEEAIRHLHASYDKHSLNTYELRGWLDQQHPLLVGVPDRISRADAKEVRWDNKTHASKASLKLGEVPTSRHPVEDSGLEDIVKNITGKDITINAEKLSAQFSTAAPQIYFSINGTYVTHRPSQHHLTFEDQDVRLQFNTTHPDFNHVYDDLRNSSHLKTTTKGVVGYGMKWLSAISAGVATIAGHPALGIGYGGFGFMAGKWLEDQYLADSARQKCYRLLGREQAFEKLNSPLLITRAPPALVEEARELYRDQVAA